MTDINAFVTRGDTNIKITDGKHLYTIISAKVRVLVCVWGRGGVSVWAYFLFLLSLPLFTYSCHRNLLQDHTAEVSPTLIQTDFSTRISTKLGNLPFTIAKDQVISQHRTSIYFKLLMPVETKNMR